MAIRNPQEWSIYAPSLTYKEVLLLLGKAYKGDSAAIRTLQKENNKMADIANRRMARLKAAKLDFYAYDRAIAFLDSENFNSFQRSKQISDLTLLGTQIREEIIFLSSKTSTVRGAKDVIDRKFKFLQNDLGLSAINYSGKKSELTPNQIELARLLSTDPISQVFRDSAGYYEDMVAALDKSIQAGMSFEEITLLFDRYLDGQLNYDDLLYELNETRRGGSKSIVNYQNSNQPYADTVAALIGQGDI